MRRRALMWSLTIGSAVTLTLWLASLVWGFGLESPVCGAVAASHGAVVIVLHHDNTDLGYLVEGIGTLEFTTWRRTRPLIWVPRFASVWPPGFTSGWWECEIPLWPVAIITGIPGAWLWATRPRRRPGECAACGYDRRGIDASRPCPECGRSPAPAG